MKNLFHILLISICIGHSPLLAQEDLEDLLNEKIAPKSQKEYVRASFKAPRIINLQSLEKVAPGALQFIVQHRFGPINSGRQQAWGLDQATIRLALEYGINKRLMVGIGRSTYQKTIDGLLKASIIRQAKGGGLPFSLLYFGSIAINGAPWQFPKRKNYFSSRQTFTQQLIIGSKISESFSFEIVPTVVHRNLVATVADQNTVFGIGVGGRIKLSKRVALNAEYIYRIPPRDKNAPSFANYYNSLSIGFDIETGGHVFQLHFSNSLPMVDKGFITETDQSWSKAGIHLGFNISRDFTIIKNKN